MVLVMVMKLGMEMEMTVVLARVVMTMRSMIGLLKARCRSWWKQTGRRKKSRAR